MLLNELFNDKFDGEYGDDRTEDYDRLKVKNTFFTVDDVRYEVRFLKINRNSYEINYGYADGGKDKFEPGKLTSGSAVKVISKVVAIAEHFINKFDPDTIKFTGDKENKLAAVYSQLARVILPRVEKLGYSILTNSGRKAIYFVITKDKTSVPAHYQTVEKKLKEAFDTPAAEMSHEEEEGDQEYNFTVNDTNYFVLFSYCGAHRYVAEYGFADTNDGKYEPPGTTDIRTAFKVLSTVIAALSKLIEDRNPSQISFSGEKSNNLSSLYSKMVTNLKSRFPNYDVTTSEKKEDVVFNIKKKIPASKPITEAFDSPVEPSDNVSTLENEKIFNFKVNGIQYFVQFIRDTGARQVVYTLNYGDVDKSGEWGYTPTGSNSTKDALAVLSTVVNIIEKFIPQAKPDFITFSGEKKDNLDKIYKMMAKNLQGRVKKLGYIVTIEDYGRNMTFYIEKIED